MSEIKDKIELELKPYENLCETTLDELKQMVNGKEGFDSQTILATAKILGEITDVKKDIVEMCYKKYILETMEEYGEEEDEDGEVRYYRGQPRSKTTGRFMRRGDGRRSYGDRRYHMTPEMYEMYPAEYYRDMDRMDGRMYYNGSSSSSGNMSSNMGSRSYSEGYNDGNSEGYSRGYSEGSRNSSNNRYERARRNYEETKMNKTGNQQMDTQNEMRELENMLNVLTTEMKELSSKMSPSEKTLANNKIANLQNMLK